MKGVIRRGAESEWQQPDPEQGGRLNPAESQPSWQKLSSWLSPQTLAEGLRRVTAFTALSSASRTEPDTT